MRNVRMEVAYDGSRFFGWQRQDGFISVQEELELGFKSLIGEAVTVHGSGRTDTGVHARRQVASCLLDSKLNDDRLRHGLNAHTSDGVVVRRLETCRDDFHPRFDARGKRYAYLTATTRFRPPMGEKYQHWTNAPLDLGALRSAAELLVGTHDFRAFANTGSERKTTVRTISHLCILPRRERFLFVVQADGFLYNMVRTIAGTLLDVGRGRLEPDSVTRAFESGERTVVGPTAPPEGLYLLRVLYDEALFPGPDRGPSGVPGLFQL